MTQHQLWHIISGIKIQQYGRTNLRYQKWFPFIGTHTDLISDFPHLYSGWLTAQVFDKKWPPVLAFNYILTHTSFSANDPVNQLIIFSHTLNVINWHTSHISQCQNPINWESISHKSSNIFVFLIYVPSCFVCSTDTNIFP